MSDRAFTIEKTILMYSYQTFLKLISHEFWGALWRSREYDRAGLWPLETLLAGRNYTSGRSTAFGNACVQKVGSVDVSGVLDQRRCGCPTSNGVLLFRKPLLPLPVRVRTRWKPYGVAFEASSTCRVRLLEITMCGSFAYLSLCPDVQRLFFRLGTKNFFLFLVFDWLCAACGWRGTRVRKDRRSRNTVSKPGTVGVR